MNTDRYQRQIILKGFGNEAQKKLSKAKILVVGAGGLGCPALQYLAAAGVGCIGIADHDVVEISNLHRQVLFGLADVGLLKVDVAANRIKQLNPDVKVDFYPISIDKLNALEIISKYDLVFDGTDNFESRYIINDSCTALKKPLVFAAVSGFEGQLAVFNLDDERGINTNYRDLFPVPPKAGEIPNCAENGVLGIVPGVIGTMAAGEIIKIITGIGKPLANRLVHYNMLTQQQYEITISPSDEYRKMNSEADFIEVHKPKLTENYIEIDVDEMNALRTRPSTLVIDVRERHEFPRLNTSVYRQIPMSEFESFATSVINEENIVLICQHGVRSIGAAEILHQKYKGTKNIFSLKGGIAKWRNYFLNQ
ncbi:ThiF family adenylyltransferase [Pedobacter sp. Leaf194]|uniref:ThiF family adenylyltransferase n=1 Tax=Pedobacter sp. Leaf194 TaxID=1736297 RepID=UPI000702F8EA|nr:ThiF family adenylyltransferase [Pedobacter sp. Leaf194]KQS36999.1 molybdopterin biosynthesis protein [Pedobacter sp. Leaf194]